MVFKIVSNGKSDKKQYKFNDVSISEVQILKHLKKAGRISESAEEFIS